MVYVLITIYQSHLHQAQKALAAAPPTGVEPVAATGTGSVVETGAPSTDEVAAARTTAMIWKRMVE